MFVLYLFWISGFTFIAGIACMMFGGNWSLKDTFSETNRIWAGLFGEKTVDSVDIAARQGKWNGTSIDNLNLNVTNSGYTVNDKDYVLHPEWR